MKEKVKLGGIISMFITKKRIASFLMLLMVSIMLYLLSIKTVDLFMSKKQNVKVTSYEVHSEPNSLVFKLIYLTSYY